MHGIVNSVFDYFRKLPTNEKNTRAGKFTHQFHKIGEAKFDFDQKSLDELIPERLLEHKKIGLLNMSDAGCLADVFEALGVRLEQHQTTDSSLATYYKFLAENELVFFDPTTMNQAELAKIQLMFGDKLVDINELVPINFRISGKIFGIVGLGRIGQKVAVKAKKLGFEVVYYSRTRKPELEQNWQIKYLPLQDLARVSDVISIHVPAHKAENLFDGQMVAAMKNGAIFINTADGNAIDQPALTKRMKAGEIMAFLDVYPGLPRKDILGLSMEGPADWKIKKELPNQVLAYRAGWKTQESIRVKTYKTLGLMTNFLTTETAKY